MAAPPGGLKGARHRFGWYFATLGFFLKNTCVFIYLAASGLSCSMWDRHCHEGVSHCGSWTLVEASGLQELQSVGLVARGVRGLRSQTRDHTRIPSIAGHS